MKTSTVNEMYQSMQAKNKVAESTSISTTELYQQLNESKLRITSTRTYGLYICRAVAQDGTTVGITSARSLELAIARLIEKTNIQTNDESVGSVA